MHNALRSGRTKREIDATLIQLAACAGFPSAVAAYAVAQHDDSLSDRKSNAAATGLRVLTVGKGPRAMTKTHGIDTVQVYEQAVAARDDAARALYRAEIAVHDAHQTHVDKWIGSANECLHAAVVQYLAANEIGSYLRDHVVAGKREAWVSEPAGRVSADAPRRQPP